MKKFNINHCFYIQIEDVGWEYLKDTVGDDYIKHCIKPYKEVISCEDWYKLQAHSVMELFPINVGDRPLYSTNILIDDNDLT